MAYPLDEPTTEDETATDPHAARARRADMARIAGDVGVAGAPVASVASVAFVAPVASIAPIASVAPVAPVAPIAPLRLPAVTPAAARVTRTLCDARVTGYLHAALGVTEWQAALVDTHSVDAAYADPGVIELTFAPQNAISAVAVRVALDLHAYPALAIAAWPDSDAHAEKPPTDVALRHAVAGVVLEPLFERLIRVGFKGPRVIAVRRGHQSDAISTRRPTGEATDVSPVVALSFALDERRHRIALSADPACYDLLDRLLRTEPTALAPSAVVPAADVSGASCTSVDTSASFAQATRTAFDLAVPGCLILGLKRLPVDTLNALEPGDVLLRATFPSLDATLLDASNDLSASHARPRAVAAWGTPGLTRLCAAVEIDGPSLVIVKEPNMSEELDPASADAGLAIDDPADPIRIGELELPVQFEIDTVALPLAQLSTLGPGYVLELPVPVADAQLRLVAHGQTIGYGELVTVGEHLGIRIIRMAHRHGPIQ